MTSGLPRLPVCLAALALIAAVACASVEADPGRGPASPPVPDGYAPLPAVEIAARLSSGGGLPSVVGRVRDEAVATLQGAGARVQVVAFDTSPAVSAQYPPPGAPLPADGLATVWVGVPPAPPPPPADTPPASSRGPDWPIAATASQPPARLDVAAAAAARSASPPAAAPPAAPASPPRTSPRQLPSAAAGTVLRGEASWYGPGFAGRQTACGDRFDPAALTLASRELRCGTQVRVTGPGGASVDATVTDWGPAEWTERRFDLSEATFAAIAPLGAGLVSVSVEVLGP